MSKFWKRPAHSVGAGFLLCGKPMRLTDPKLQEAAFKASAQILPFTSTEENTVAKGSKPKPMPKPMKPGKGCKG